MRWLLFALLLLTQCHTTPPPQKTSDGKNEKALRLKVANTIHSHRRYLSQCYGSTLMQRGKAETKGNVFVSFKIGPDGHAFSPVVVPEKSSLQNEKLNQCLFAGLASWDFPVDPARENMEVNFSFQFHDTPPAGMQNKLDKFQNLRRH